MDVPLYVYFTSQFSIQDLHISNDFGFDGSTNDTLFFKDSLFVIASYVALLQIMHVIPIVTDALLLTETLDPNSTGKSTDRNFVDNFLQVVIYLALVANI